MAVDYIGAQGHVDRALGRYLSEPDFLARLHKAFRMLQSERRMPGASADEDLAAAEHYLFARQAVATNACNQGQMRALVIGYGSLKFTLQRVGLGKLMQTTDNPTSRASRDSIEWGLMGVRDGEIDRLKYLPGSTPAPFNPDFVKTGSSLDDKIKWLADKGGAYSQ
ncbi:MAG TPA: hypothetical protein VJR58_32835 [Vineibacter sp.]|nr:hypothetical protein [Vineibacter sp.]